MNVYIISDSHLKHEKMKTYCMRPSNFTELTHRNVMNTVKATDTLIHLGDVGISKYEDWGWMVQAWPCRKILIRGNHDRSQSCTWWMEHGFDFACDGLKFRKCWLSHEPAGVLPEGCLYNVHGHLHNIWHGFHNVERIKRDKELLGVDFTKRLKYPYQRLFAVEYTDYKPVEFDKFISHPDKYQARGPVGPDKEQNNREDGKLLASSDTEGWRE